MSDLLKKNQYSRKTTARNKKNSNELKNTFLIFYWEYKFDLCII
jgi:hypothetical protein